eukprot:SAG31_NODE_7102_length_1788_cov_1.198342_1_plen_284_part_00
MARAVATPLLILAAAVAAAAEEATSGATAVGQLRQENVALRQEVARLRAQLAAAATAVPGNDDDDGWLHVEPPGASTWLRPAAADDDDDDDDDDDEAVLSRRRPPRRADFLQGQCPPAPRPPWTGEPNGSYTKSCSNCRRNANILKCGCLKADALDTSHGPLLPLGNVTGSWDLSAPGQLSNGKVTLRMQELTSVVTVRTLVCRVVAILPPISDCNKYCRISAQSFTFKCADGGYSEVCNPSVPGHNGTVWHEGRGKAAVSTRRAELFFDNLVQVSMQQCPCL